MGGINERFESSDLDVRKTQFQLVGHYNALYSNRPTRHIKMSALPSRTVASKLLETFANPNPQRDYHIHMEIPEFTCLCPKTGQPDFATLILDYIADTTCVELKSLKLYIWLPPSSRVSCV